MIRRIFKGLTAFIFIVLTQGCATTSFQHRIVDDGLGGTTKQFFAYGTYCGPGHPPSLGKVGLDGIERTLLSLFPPVDDLDSICYAHDYCYALGGNRITCDSVFHDMVIKYQSSFTGKGCWNVATDITIAFFGKFYEEGISGSQTFANRFVSSLIGIPISAFWFAIKLPTVPFLSEPEEGSCNFAEESFTDEIINEFESLYPKALFNESQESIKIPVPASK